MCERSRAEGGFLSVRRVKRVKRVKRVRRVKRVKRVERVSDVRNVLGREGGGPSVRSDATL